jgi:hypothetical protein
MAQSLLKRGLLVQRSDPVGHVAAKVFTYRHPNGSVAATLYLVTNMAAPSYWRRVLYDAPRDFDRIVCEDGCSPVQDGTAAAAASRILRVVAPIFPQNMISTADTAHKFLTPHPHRDKVESRIVYESVKSDADPLVDPRARRAFDALEGLASEGSGTIKVALPWHMYHAPYLLSRFQRDGWTLEAEEEILLMTRKMVVASMMAVAFGTVIIVYVLSNALFRFFFGGLFL